MMNCRPAILSSALISVINLLSVCAEDTASTPLQSESNPTADQHALHAVFQDDALQDNSLAIHQAAFLLPPDARFRFLASWVLPNDQHPTFRVTGEFGSTNPPPFAEQPTGVAARLSPGVVVMSPAVDLVDTARQIHRLKELRERTVSADVPGTDVWQRYARATLLVLIDLARDDPAAALLAFDEIMSLTGNLDNNSLRARWSAVLMLRTVLPSRHKDVRRSVTEHFFSIYSDLKFYSSDLQLDVVNDHLRTLFALTNFLGDDGSPELLSRKVSGQWLSFSYNDSSTRGNGRPPVIWHAQKGDAVKLSGHEMDYLSFRSPLRGNFEVECDFSTHHGEQVSFMIAGLSVQAESDETVLRTGNFRKPYSDAVLTPRLTRFEEMARFRAVVQKGALTCYLNGRAVLERKLAPEHDPWVALRMWRRSLGRVHDIRITGDPVIPDEVNLTGDPELSGWAPYFEEGFGPGAGNWQAIDADQNGAGIFGRRRPEFAGSSLQKLLRYCRPVAEDGTIEYDFFYKPGEACVHPALDRLAFILDPGGVKIHWITDRRYEYSPLDPANVVDEPENQRGSQPLPLKNDAWNQLKLEVKGEQILLMLNGQFIYERSLEDSNQRTFGLFHFADRTEARIRNVIWRGDWPKLLPSVENQDLASSNQDFLDEGLAKLTANLHHDFRHAPFEEHFDLVSDESAVEENEHGVQTTLSGGVGFKEFRFSPLIHGDFDITVVFQDLDITMPFPRWTAGIGVRVVLDSSTDDRLGLYRTLERNADNRRTSFFHSFRTPDGELKYPGDYVAEESQAGRFRLARREATFYAMYAADDSPNFRLIGKYKATTDPVAVQGLRLIAKADDSVSVTATWKNIVIRAEKISGLRPSDQDAAPLIAKLNEQRDALPARTVNFAVPGSITSDVRISATTASVFTPGNDGLRVTTTGGDRQAACVFSGSKPFNRGVDVEFTLDIHQLGTDDASSSACEIAMKVFFESSQLVSRSPREATIILRAKADGVRELIARIVHRNGAGQLAYLPLQTVRVQSPDSFRIAVHEGTLYFLYSEAGSDDYRIAAASPIRGELPATGFNLKCVAVGNGHKADFVMKKLVIHEQRDEPPGATTEVTRSQ